MKTSVFATIGITDEALGVRLYVTDHEKVFDFLIGDETRSFASREDLMKFIDSLQDLLTTAAHKLRTGVYYDVILQEFEDKGPMLMAQETLKDQQRGLEAVKARFPNLPQFGPLTLSGETATTQRSD